MYPALFDRISTKPPLTRGFSPILRTHRRLGTGGYTFWPQDPRTAETRGSRVYPRNLRRRMESTAQPFRSRSEVLCGTLFRPRRRRAARLLRSAVGTPPGARVRPLRVPSGGAFELTWPEGQEIQSRCHETRTASAYRTIPESTQRIPKNPGAAYARSRAHHAAIAQDPASRRHG